MHGCAGGGDRHPGRTVRARRQGQALARPRPGPDPDPERRRLVQAHPRARVVHQAWLRAPGRAGGDHPRRQAPDRAPDPAAHAEGPQGHHGARCGSSCWRAGAGDRGGEEGLPRLARAGVRPLRRPPQGARRGQGQDGALRRRGQVAAARPAPLPARRAARRRRRWLPGRRGRPVDQPVRRRQVRRASRCTWAATGSARGRSWRPHRRRHPRRRHPRARDRRLRRQRRCARGRHRDPGLVRRHQGRAVRPGGHAPAGGRPPPAAR